MFAHGGAGTASMCHMHNSYTHALASSASLIGSEFPRTGLRPFVVNRNIRNYLWYGGVARGGLRAKVLGRLGRRLQALSKSVCSILPVARWSIGPELSGAPAFSCTATGEERYFCCPLDRCGLAPASRTVSSRSGKDPSPPSGPFRILSLAGPLQHHTRRPALRFAPPRSQLSGTPVKACARFSYVEYRRYVARCT